MQERLDIKWYRPRFVSTVITMSKGIVVGRPRWCLILCGRGCSIKRYRPRLVSIEDARTVEYIYKAVLTQVRFNGKMS